MGKNRLSSTSSFSFSTSVAFHQHGVAGGYYLAFFLGGFVQTAGRLCRSNLRPLFLTAAPPASDAPTAKPTNGTAAGEKPSLAKLAPAPQPTAAKPLYDAAGTVVSVLLLNFTAGPFMIQSLTGSLQAWAALGWYGLVMVGACLAFFYAGGARLVRAKGGAPRGSSGKESVPASPGVATVPPVDLGIRQAERKLL